MKNKKILIAIGLIAVAGGVVYYGYKKGLWLNKKNKTTVPSTNTPSTQMQTTTATSGNKLVNIGRISTGLQRGTTITRT